MNHSVRGLICLCAACMATAGLLVSGCGSGSGTSGSSDTEEPILIGAVMGFTGVMVTWDGPVFAAAELAAEDMNNAGGVLGRKIRFIKGDTKSEAANAPVVAGGVLDDGPEALLVTTDFDLGSPAALVAQNAGVLSFSGAISPKFGVQGIGDMAYSFSDSAMSEAAVGAQFCIDKGWKTAYQITDITLNSEKDYAQYFEETFTKLGGKVVGQDVFKNDDQSIAAQITKLKSVSPQPDVLNLNSYAPGGPAALRQIRAAGIDLPVIGDDNWDGTFWLEAVPGVKDVYGCVPASQFGDDPDEKVNEFFDRLKTKLNKDSLDSSLAIGGYAFVQAYAHAIELAGTTDPAAVKAELDKLTDFPAVSGPMTYTSTQHILIGRPMTVIGFWDGTGHFVARVTPSYTPEYEF
jgi:branched-chain amino acid transport system substrate-binding protein